MRFSARWSSCSATRGHRPRSWSPCARTTSAAVAEHPELAALMADGTMLVGSPTPVEIERAITRPAARAGLTLEDGLAGTMVDEAGNEPGLLPLLSVALTQVWEQRTGERLTYAGYVGVGGIAGAISTLAEGVWSELSVDEQSVARLLLLRLAGPGDGAERRPSSGADRGGRSVVAARPSSVSWIGWPRLVLLTIGDAHVEVAHEALFREWPRLQGWLTDDAAGRAVQRRLALAASEWAAEGREPGVLWRGTQAPRRHRDRRFPARGGDPPRVGVPRRRARRWRTRRSAPSVSALRPPLGRTAACAGCWPAPSSCWRRPWSPVCSPCVRGGKQRSRRPVPRPRRCPPTPDGSPPTPSTRTDPPSPLSRRSRRPSASRAPRRTARC